MTTAPMCKVCGVRHFGVAHQWPNQPAPTPPADHQKTIAGLRARIAELENAEKERLEAARLRKERSRANKASAR